MITFMAEGLKMDQHIILLHGALGSKNQFNGWEEGVTGSSQVHCFNFHGHGGDPIPDKMLIGDLVKQLEDYIRQNIPQNSSLTLFGYSMGGYAALLLASKNICKIDKIVTLGTKLRWDPEIAAREIKMLDPDIISTKLSEFALELEQRHQPQDWKLLLKRTAELMMDLGEQQYLSEETFSKISSPCKLMLGDKDKMVTLDETVFAYQKIKGASLSVLPSTPHPIEKVSIERLAFELKN